MNNWQNLDVSPTFHSHKEAGVAQRLTPRTPDLEVQGSSSAHCVVSLDKELYSSLSFCLSSPRCINGYQWHTAKEGGGGGCNPAMDWYPIQGGVAILLGMLHAKETRISCGHLGLWLICAFTFFYHSHKMHLLGSCTDQNDRFLFPFINSTSEIPTLSYTWSLKEVPPLGVASLGPFKANVESTPPPPGVLLA